MSPEEGGQFLRLHVPIHSEAELTALRGALLAARASELSQVRRRGDRLTFGYGSDSARESMNAEVDLRATAVPTTWRTSSRLSPAQARLARTIAGARVES